VIGKPEIITIAGQLGLNPHIVEKDYALGWLLAAIFAHERLADSWVFKGGTCLKKCFFETYRFSEDLDFTLKDESHLDEAFLKEVFAEIGEWVYEQSGLEMPADGQDFDLYGNPRGNMNCQGKISYRGPVSPTTGGWPRIKIDITADERLVLAPVRIPVSHPYSDVPDGGIVVQAYAYEEAFGEKVRALAERARPRDLYDVVNLYRNLDACPEPSVLLDVLRQKCAFKGIPIPRAADLDAHRGDLEAAWEGMLRHQLPALPPVESFWSVLPEFFAWLQGGEPPTIPASYATARGETVLRDRTLPLGAASQSHIEVIRFAAANRLCVDLDYQGSTRRIEPYSLRRTQDGNIILHAWNVDRDASRSYRVDRIEGVRTSNQVFAPRYAVELTPSGPVSIPPTQPAPSSGTASYSGFGSQRPTRRVPGIRAALGFGHSLSSGPTYVYECGLCHKRFRRKTQDSSLNPHKTPDGWPCPGRMGWLVDTKY
jgi:predicted nucleotidyltransferase component of viral defense system